MQSNPKFWPYFKDAIGAIDGTHIPVVPPSHTAAAFRNCKGFLSQNCLFICDFDLFFKYALTGWEGSASDSRVYDNALSWDLNIPEGKYLLADLGYPSRPTLLVPYRGTRYHLAEWGRASVRYASFYFFLRLLIPFSPENKEELFNLRHASLRNAIERIFSILKKRFRILLLGPKYPIDIQVRIPLALAALYNFIHLHESNDAGEEDSDSEDGAGDGAGDNWNTNHDDFGYEDRGGLRDKIATEMWADYLTFRHTHDMTDSDNDSGDDHM